MKIVGRLINKLAVIFLCSLGCANEEQPGGVQLVPNPKDAGGYVSDQDQILAESTIAQLNVTLTALDQSGKAQVAVVLLNSIGEQVPKDFAVALFNFWEIGSKETDNGLLILVVKDQHRVEFETGYGLEAVLPDVTCFRIQQKEMVPHFKANEFDNGMLQGITALSSYLHATNNLEDSTHAVDSQRIAGVAPAMIDYHVQVEDGVYELHTFKKHRKMSFLEAWSIIQSNYLILGLPHLPDTSMSSVEKTAEGYKYTIRIPYEFSISNLFRLLLNSLGFLAFNAIVAAIVMYVSFRGQRHQYAKAETKRSLFSNRLFFNKGFAFLFLLILPMILLAAYLVAFKSTDAPAYVSLASGYLSWALYVHVHYMIILPVKAAAVKDRHTRHETLAEAFRNLRVLSFVFPLPFLGLYYRIHRVRMQKLRELPYRCGCGAMMKKLGEVQDDDFLSSGDLREEELKSIDYDVWICSACNRKRVLRYESFRSSAMHCNACLKKTVVLDKREVVEEASTIASGYGYNHFLCKNCNQRTKIRFTIAKESSSESGGSSSDSGGSSVSWGGGSSGGGGAGSSW